MKTTKEKIKEIKTLNDTKQKLVNDKTTIKK